MVVVAFVVEALIAKKLDEVAFVVEALTAKRLVTVAFVATTFVKDPVPV